MKNIIIILSVLLVVASCQKEDNNTPDIGGTTISIQELRDYLPTTCFQPSSIVYVNSSYETKVLSVSSQEEIVERTQDDVTYQSESFEIRFYDERDDNFNITISGGANYGESYEEIKGITAWLMPFNGSGSTLLNIRFRAGAAIQDGLGPDFHSTITLNQRSFSDVYLSTAPRYSAFSELAINSDVGVVAFRDAYDELWVYDYVVE